MFDKLMKQVPLFLPFGEMELGMSSPGEAFDRPHNPLLWLAAAPPSPYDNKATGTQAAAATTLTLTLDPATASHDYPHVFRVRVVTSEDRPSVNNARAALTFYAQTRNRERVTTYIDGGGSQFSESPSSDDMFVYMNMRSDSEGGFYIHVARRPTDFPLTIPDRACLEAFDNGGSIEVATRATVVMTGLTADPAQTGVQAEFVPITPSSPYYEHYVDTFSKWATSKGGC